MVLQIAAVERTEKQIDLGCQMAKERLLELSLLVVPLQRGCQAVMTRSESVACRMETVCLVGQMLTAVMVQHHRRGLVWQLLSGSVLARMGLPAGFVAVVVRMARPEWFDSPVDRKEKEMDSRMFVGRMERRQFVLVDRRERHSTVLADRMERH